MIPIRAPELPPDVSATLAGYQAEVDQAGDYAAQVERARDLFSLRNRKDNRAFHVVREQLDLLCHGPRRCMYCEDAPADEVEHVRPKALYPDLVFAWRNYVYACGPCNGPKSSRFAVFSHRTQMEVDVTRPRGAPVQPPEPGHPLLIDPRSEDPLDLLRLDLRGTFLFQPAHPSGNLAYRRAEYTIDVLNLNGQQGRDYLPRARSAAYHSFHSNLCRYLQLRKAGASSEKLDRYRQAIVNTNHRTVWVEMQRQHEQHPELRPLFRAADEALDW